MIGNQGFKVNKVIYFHLQGDYGFFIIFSSSRGSKLQT